MAMDARLENFRKIEFQGKISLFTNNRIDIATMPEGLHRYEIRHADNDWGNTCQLAYSIHVNHFGTLITNEEIQLRPDAYLDFKLEDLNFLADGYVSIDEYAEQHPPVKKTVFTIHPIVGDKTEWLYSDSSKDTERGIIGHMRGDFGDGNEFWTTWWPHQDELNKQPFKTEFTSVIEWLRQDYGPLKNLSSMSDFCQAREDDAKLNDGARHEYGFQIETPSFQYFLRCNPVPRDYNMYIYCCDREAQRQHDIETPKKEKESVLEQLKAARSKLPPKKVAPHKSAERDL